MDELFDDVVQFTLATSASTTFWGMADKSKNVVPPSKMQNQDISKPM